MFAYLLIVAELAILYTVFWYIFLREPKPFKVEESLWGHYEVANRKLEPSSHSADSHADWMTLNESLYNELCVGRARAQKQRAHGRCNSLPSISRTPHMKYGWVSADEEPVTLLDRLASGFERTVEVLRVI